MTGMREEVTTIDFWRKTAFVGVGVTVFIVSFFLLAGWLPSGGPFLLLALLLSAILGSGAGRWAFRDFSRRQDGDLP